MKKLGRFLIVAFLSSCAFAASPAYAVDCYATGEAMAYVRANGLKPLVLTGERAKTFLPVNGARIRTVQFAALVFNDEGEGAVFFGNVSQVCGPYRLTKEQVLAFLRPA